VSKRMRTIFFTAIVSSVLCAGTVSARQLRSEPRGFACSGTCSATRPCPNSCFCSFTTPTTAFCTVRPGGLAPQGK
jgi:hypothetical protein